MKTNSYNRIPTFMILPSMACQASCTYCFGPHEGAIMDKEKAKQTICFIRHIADQCEGDQISIVFHGGEPLLAPLSVWKTLFSQIKYLLRDYKVQMSLQSNLWAMDDELLALFVENEVAIGSSIDGPEDICDISRGEGYFAKTFPNVQKCSSKLQSVSAIATISKQTLSRVEEICAFFRDGRMPLVLHGAVPSYQSKENIYALTPKEYSEMIQNLLPWYVENRKKMRITTLDNYIELCANGSTQVCTFNQCLGMFLAIDPKGDITSCQRLAGKEEFCLGNIDGFASLEQLYGSEAARRQLEREREVAEVCASCAHANICKGGCYYNAITAGDGVKDYLCEAYQDIFSFITERLFEEMQSEENLELLQQVPSESDEHLLLREGR